MKRWMFRALGGFFFALAGLVAALSVGGFLLNMLRMIDVPLIQSGGLSLYIFLTVAIALPIGWVGERCFASARASSR
jgi:hypothetical protein